MADVNNQLMLDGLVADINKTFKLVSDDMNTVVKDIENVRKINAKTKKNMLIFGLFMGASMLYLACRQTNLEEKLEEIVTKNEKKCDEFVTNLKESVTNLDESDDLK